MNDLDIRLQGRRWTIEEFSRHDELPGRLEMMRGKLCFDDEQRMLLLAALLEHIGTGRAVSLGPLSAWQAAIRQRQDGEDSAEMLAVGVEPFRPRATQRLSFAKQRGIEPKLTKQRRRRT